MIEQPDMFTYPASPGWKTTETSRVAAEEITPRARTLREQVLDLIQYHDLTTDEVAAKLGKSVLAIRPRFSELSRMGLIHESGHTRKNASGVRAIVWHRYQ